MICIEYRINGESPERILCRTSGEAGARVMQLLAHYRARQEVLDLHIRSAAAAAAASLRVGDWIMLPDSTPGKVIFLVLTGDQRDRITIEVEQQTPGSVPTKQILRDLPVDESIYVYERGTPLAE